MQKSKSFNNKETEAKWQAKWLSSKVYSPELKKAKSPFYNLMMFPYPSAEGLHVGNMYAFTGADVYGRFQRMNGKDVFEPIGLDGFGIHSENYAIKVGLHPKEHAEISERHFYKQLHMIGNAYDWTRTLETYDPDYYKWTQWLFIQMWKSGLAYKGKAMVNWCPKDKTVLADEQVINGCCERCGTKVVKREMSSWFFKITKYADRLLNNIKKINWPEKIKTAQRNWIGKSEGMLITAFNELNADMSSSLRGNSALQSGEDVIKFKTESGSTLEVFTTRPDTLNAVTFLATSKLYDPAFAEATAGKGKVGKFTGKYAIDPLSGRKLPIWDTNYVTPDYGTGIVMGVPAHDERDMEFAKKYHLEVINKDPDDSLWNKIEKEGWGRRHTNYHLRDWLISRQRYWGPPIPMIYCADCASKTFKGLAFKGGAGWFPVPEEDLPVILPDIKDFKPKGDGTSPLHNAPDAWKKVKCPKCGSLAERELDVSDTFLDSSWYFLAYPNLGTKEWAGSPSASTSAMSSVPNGSGPFNKQITKKWLPVDAYIGGAEHAVLHLLYARFVTMVLHDLGYLDFEEPFPFLFGHGLIIKEGAKMSKSRGNIVTPDDYINKFGADALRTYLMFLGPFDQGGDFRDTGIEGMNRFINRIWRLYLQFADIVLIEEKDSKDVLVKMHQTIKKVTEDIQEFGYNTAIASIMEFVNLLYEKAAVSHQPSAVSHQPSVRCAEWDEALRVLAKLIAPFAPHLAEEVWCEVLEEKFSIHNAPWPKYDTDLARKIENVIVVQVNGKLRSQLSAISYQLTTKKEVERLARKDEKVVKWLKDKKIKKTIFVPGKLINFVTL